MRKTFITSIIVAIAAVITVSSCQEGIEELNNGSNGAFKATATIDNGTRVSYVVDDVNHKVSQTWEVGDVVYCLDNDTKKDCPSNYTSDKRVFCFTVTSVTDGVATFDTGDYNPGDATTIYALYCPGTVLKRVSAYSGKNMYYRCSLDLTSFAGSLNDKPCLPLSAVGTIEGNKVSFSFVSEGSVVSVTGLTAKANEVISRIKVQGLASKMSVEYTCNQDTKAITPIFPSTGTFSDINLTLSEPIACDSDGRLTHPVYFPVLPSGASDVTIFAYGQDDAVYSTSFHVDEVVSGKYYYADKVLGETYSVASIGTDEFYTIDDAFAAANSATSDCTIKLLCNTGSGGIVTINNANGKTVTLDLDGKTLSAGIVANTNLVINGENGTIDGGSNKALDVEKSATVTVNGGTITTANTSAVIYSAATAGQLTLNDVVAISTAGSSTRAIYTYSSGSTIIVNGGSYTASRALQSQPGKITINGATLNGAMYVGNSSAVVTITDGYFNGSFSRLNSAPLSCFKISGGYFSVNPDASSIVPGYAVESNSDATYKYKVVEAAENPEAPDVAQVNGVGCATFAAAVAAANSSAADCEIKLIVDCATSEISINNANGKAVTLNLNGCTLTASGSVIFESDGVIEGGSGKIEETGNVPAVLVKKGQVTINGGTYNSKYSYGTIRGLNTGADITLNNVTATNATGAVLNTGNTGSDDAATIVVNSGSYTCSGAGIAIRARSGEITVKGGTFVGQLFCRSSATLNIEGGFFGKGSNSYLISNSSGYDPTKITFTGGYFADELTWNGGAYTFANGYELAPSTEYTGYSYHVQPVASVSTIAPWKAGSSFQTDL